jgi:hypothetical protein
MTNESRPIWTEGICGDGAAILRDGVMQPIEEVIAALNAAELSQPEPEGDQVCCMVSCHWDGPPPSPHASVSDWFEQEGSKGILYGLRISALPSRNEALRTALAQPEPQGVTDEDWEAIKDRLWRHYETTGYQGERFIYQGDFDTALDVARQELARFARATIQPVAVSERLPESGKKVIAYYLNALGNSRTILAEWVPAKTKADDGLTDDDFAEYDEESDEYYWPEGWYEVIENWDDYGAVFVNEGEITHWRPLPPGPHHALPIPAAH